MNEPKELPKVAYRVDEAARLLNVHPSTIYEAGAGWHPAAQAAGPPHHHPGQSPRRMAQHARALGVLRLHPQEITPAGTGVERRRYG